MKIGQQMLKFQKLLNDQIRIFSSPIFIFSIKSIKKHSLYIFETCTNKLINFQIILTHFCEEKENKYCLGLKWTDKEGRIHILEWKVAC